MDAGGIVRYLGWPFIRNVAIPWIGKSSMKLSGIEFFTNQHDLRRQHFDNLFSTAKTVDAIVIIGRTLREHKLTNIRKFERIILPDPKSESIIDYAETVKERGYIQRNIAEATEDFISKRIKVRWYPHAIHHAVLIVDPELYSGWVQVDCVLPFSIPNLRPSWRVYRKHNEQLVISMRDVFDKMWDKSNEPDETVIKKILG